jgi:hypothetical protein
MDCQSETEISTASWRDPAIVIGEWLAAVLIYQIVELGNSFAGGNSHHFPLRVQVITYATTIGLSNAAHKCRAPWQRVK